MRSKLIVSSLALFAAMTLLFPLGTSPASAATFYLGGMPWKAFDVKYVGLPSYVADNVTLARYEYNGETDATISYRGSADAQVTAVNDTQVDWTGLYQPRPASFTIVLNLVLIGRYAPPNGYGRAVRSTAAHEWGHSLSLADNPSSVANHSVMNYARNRATIYGPTGFDAGNVNYWYN